MTVKKLTQTLWCVPCEMVTFHQKIGKSRAGVARYKCKSCGQKRSVVTPS